MPSRYRIPTIFSLYMVDVLCCALGCVILLWFLKIHEAKGHMQEAERREKAAAQTSARLAKTQGQLDESRRQLAETRERLSKAENERDSARARLAELDKQLLALQAEKADMQDRLTKAVREQRDLAKDLTAARQRVATLDMLVRDKETLARTATRSAEELAERLRDADARLKQLGPLAELVPGLRQELRIYRDKVSSLEGQALALEKEVSERKKELAGAGRSLHGLEQSNLRLEREIAARERDLAGARRTIEALQGEKKTLIDEASRVRAAAENRFAGIALTGRRVVFLIDMSGSMELVDEKTLAPDKWTGVRDTMSKIMRSLPDLEKFQVILFSDRVTYPLGNQERWIDFDSGTSADRASRVLAAIKPRGNTNMYAGFEAAFRFRSLGLDTVYLLSDGLANVGPGLSAEAARSLKEPERAEILSKYVRRTLASDWNSAGPARRTRVRINTVGFFYESPDVGAFLWALARENDGSFVGMSKP